jgi:hypothetical protein
MKTLVFVSLVLLLTAGLFIHSQAVPKAPAKTSERAIWRDGQPKHWRAILLRKD